jgi:hypothetical protein
MDIAGLRLADPGSSWHGVDSAMTRATDASKHPRRIFRDRCEAGCVLADLLGAYRDRGDVIVLGLARGGIPVAWEVAAALRAPLDAFVVRKLGVPDREEFAVGALASGGRIVINDDVVRGLRITLHNCATWPRAKAGSWSGARPPIAAGVRPSQ